MLDAHSAGGLFDKGAFEDTGWSGTGGYQDYFDARLRAAGDRRRPAARRRRRDLEYAYQDWALAQMARRLRQARLEHRAVREA